MPKAKQYKIQRCLALISAREERRKVRGHVEIITPRLADDAPPTVTDAGVLAAATTATTTTTTTTTTTAGITTTSTTATTTTITTSSVYIPVALASVTPLSDSWCLHTTTYTSC